MRCMCLLYEYCIIVLEDCIYQGWDVSSGIILYRCNPIQLLLFHHSLDSTDNAWILRVPYPPEDRPQKQNLSSGLSLVDFEDFPNSWSTEERIKANRDTNSPHDRPLTTTQVPHTTVNLRIKICNRIHPITNTNGFNAVIPSYEANLPQWPNGRIRLRLRGFVASVKG
jgi:hypothetical protein